MSRTQSPGPTRTARAAALVALLGAALGVALASDARAQGSTRGSARFEVSFGRDARAEPVTGRVYVALSRTSSAASTPIQQTGETGVPLFGVDVEALAPAGAP